MFMIPYIRVSIFHQSTLAVVWVVHLGAPCPSAPKEDLTLQCIIRSNDMM